MGGGALGWSSREVGRAGAPSGKPQSSPVPESRKGSGQQHWKPGGGAEVQGRGRHCLGGGAEAQGAGPTLPGMLGGGADVGGGGMGHGAGPGRGRDGLGC